MHSWYWNCGWIALLGGLGSVARYGLTELVETWFGKAFPYGTMSVNLLGCFVFGIVWASCTRGVMNEEWKTIVLVGFLGGFTTFSSFAFHNEQMLVKQQWEALLVNVVVQNVVGIAAIWIGIRLTEMILPVPVAQ